MPQMPVGRRNARPAPRPALDHTPLSDRIRIPTGCNGGATAPCASRHSRPSAADQIARPNAQFRNDGTNVHARYKIHSVATALGRLEKRLARNHLSAGEADNIVAVGLLLRGCLP